MATAREIQNRIHSVQGTQQITRAMKLVSTAKLQKVRSITEAGKPYFSAMYDTIRDVVARCSLSSDDIVRMLRKEQDAGDKAQDAPEAILLITSNRGLAGGYNVNVCRLAEKRIKEAAQNGLTTRVFCLGKKGEDFAAHHGFETERISDIAPEAMTFRDAEKLSDILFQKYCAGEISGITIAYTSFANTITQTPELMRLLPFEVEGKNGQEQEIGPVMQYEPSEEEVLSALIPNYLAGILNGVIVESVTSEHGARMTAMDSATDNADEIVSDLTLLYNRVRQGRITQELTEIVNGANALE